MTACGVLTVTALVGVSFLDARAGQLLAQQKAARIDVTPFVPTSVYTSTINPSTTAYIVERNHKQLPMYVEQGQILAMDTASMKTIGHIDTFHDPQVALAPDGKYLYVAETFIGQDVAREQLRVIETATGQAMNTIAIPHRFRSKLTAIPGVLAVSHGGRYVHFGTVRGSTEQNTRYAVATYDSATGTLLPHDIALPSFCGGAMVWPLPTEGTIVAACRGHAHSVTVAHVPSSKASTIAVPDPPGFINGIPKGGQTTALVGSTLSRDGTTLYLVTRAGTIHHFDLASHTFLPSIPLDLGHDIAMAHDQIQLSRDGQRLYLGVGRTEATWTGVSEEVRVYDTATWRLIRTVLAPEPARSIALTSDEHLLMLHNASRTIFRTVPDAPNSAAVTTLDTPGNQLDALVTLP